MSDEREEVMHGRGNVFRDFGDPDAEILQEKAILAGKIIDVLDRWKLSVRAAEAVTGIASMEFSRIRKAKLQRFTLERLSAIADKLDPGQEC